MNITATTIAIVACGLWVSIGGASTDNTGPGVVANTQETAAYAPERSNEVRAHHRSNNHASRPNSPARDVTASPKNDAQPLHRRYFALHAYGSSWRYPRAFHYYHGTDSRS